MECAKITPQHVNNWFKRGVPMARIDEVAELLTVNARWLRSGDGPKHPNESANENTGDDTRTPGVRIVVASPVFPKKA
ncbi:Cro/CI family transcriptional regulator [Pseudomonas syringae pv. actinidiae ICMP 19071]|nr:Cro/CI family transcriptional regulator [Pseudomonas syringae pv. actinidiae ICMP 19071]EPM80581.1 Cro/CI family transcriptional regulator [Pseudomonas syringae pv. actinidiae ICMP 19072]